MQDIFTTTQHNWCKMQIEYYQTPMVSTMDLVRYKTCTFKHITEQVCEHKMDLKDYFKLKERIKKLSISYWHRSGQVLFKLKQQSIYKSSTAKGNITIHFHKSSHKTKVTKSMGIYRQICFKRHMDFEQIPLTGLCYKTQSTTL